MSNDSDKQDPLAHACELVGRFLYHFGRVERKIDEAVIKLLDLSEKLTPVVTAIDFARKLRLVKLSADTQISDTAEKKKAHDLCSRVYAVNEERTLVAHSDFDAAPGGVQFGKVTTRDGHVLDVGPLWLDAQFDECYKKMSALEADLDKLINQLKRGEPPEEWFTYNIPNLPAYLHPASLWVPRPPDPEPGSS
jgi:hypothetical protein